MKVLDIIREEILMELRQPMMNYIKQQLPNTPDHILKDMVYGRANTREDIQELKFKIDLLRDMKWELKKNFPVNINIFDADTQSRIKARKGGSANPYQVPNDAQRHEQQKQLILQRGLPQEPITLVKTPDGKYELWEGWHRMIQLLEMYPQGFNYPNVYIGYQ